MYTPLHCIALRTVRHSDTRAILTAWSAERGRVAIALPDGKGREAARRRALTMPLAMFEGVAQLRPAQDILQLRDLRPSPGSPVAAAPGPARTMLHLFLAEVLDHLLRESAPEPLLADYLFSSLRILGSLSHPTALANYHIVFLFRLARFLGVAPDMTVPAGSRPEQLIFDLRDARFRHSLPSHPLFYSGPEAKAVAILDIMNFQNMHRFHFSRDERSRILDAILEYYRIHLLPPGDLRSPDILRQLY
ncbi:MAG: DNA repair protein RecO C-terminal domain-containing protein [Muribaculaceae bacterium]|nr:DNA repair protein RecO C-terminal domain-containing protein [Muribaculaceae bacterium]